MYQRFECIGRVVADAEQRFTGEAKAVTNFSVAVNEKRGERESTLWVNVSTWSGLADVCNKYVKKGMLVFVEGRLNASADGNPRAYTRKDGSVSASLDVNADTVKFLTDRKAAESYGGDDDIPF